MSPTISVIVVAIWVFGIPIAVGFVSQLGEAHPAADFTFGLFWPAFLPIVLGVLILVLAVWSLAVGLTSGYKGLYRLGVRWGSFFSDKKSS